ncbi:hypothetical protein [Actinomycetospora sp.]
MTNMLRGAVIGAGEVDCPDGDHDNQRRQADHHQTRDGDRE